MTKLRIALIALGVLLLVAGLGLIIVAIWAQGDDGVRWGDTAAVILITGFTFFMAGIAPYGDAS